MYRLIRWCLLIAAIAPLNAFAATKTLIVAGGCFWCVESDFEKLKGVKEVVSGYTGGTTDNPTYRNVTQGGTGHYEAVKITYDDTVASLPFLLHYYWRTIDPTDAIGQFCDKGSSYRTALFYQDDAEREAFEKSLAEVEQTKPFKGKIVTPILPAKAFYLAEDYHQDYYKKSQLRYKYYRYACGRDKRIEKLWGSVISDDGTNQ